MLECFPTTRIGISSDKFYSLYKYNKGDVLNLERTNSSLNSYLENSIKKTLEFENLHIQDKKNMKFTAKSCDCKDLYIKDPYFIEIKYEFKFTNSEGKTSLISKSVWFNKDSKL